MRILLVNDDGIAAEGILALIKELSKEHQIVVAAPARQQSGMSHALTVRQDIVVEHELKLEEKFGIEAWKIDGTPADCVKLYLEALKEKKDWPDLVISGINDGANLGTDVVYSGTVGAAVEGYLHQIPSLAVSLVYFANLSFEEVAQWIAKSLSKFFSVFGPYFLLNVNFPKQYAKGNIGPIFTTVGKRDYKNAFTVKNTNGKMIFSMAGEIYDEGNTDNTDVFQTNTGHITVTPLAVDMTDGCLYTKLKGNFSVLMSEMGEMEN